MNLFSKAFLMSLAFLATTPLYTIQANPGKALKNENIKLLDIKLRSTAVVIYRIHKSSQVIDKCIGTIKAVHQHKMAQPQEAEFIQRHLTESLELVSPFINDIRAYKELILPLVTESNNNHAIKNSYLTKFFQGGDALEGFTTKTITSVESLQGMLEEIHAFFQDLFASLSKDTKDAYKKWISEQSKK